MHAVRDILVVHLSIHIGSVRQGVKEIGDAFPEITSDDAPGRLAQWLGTGTCDEGLEPISVFGKVADGAAATLLAPHKGHRVRVPNDAHGAVVEMKATYGQVARLLPRQHLPAEEVEVLLGPLPTDRRHGCCVEASAATSNVKACSCQPRSRRAPRQLPRWLNTSLQIQQRRLAGPILALVELLDVFQAELILNVTDAGPVAVSRGRLHEDAGLLL
mmetsp:Transcript_102130/g.255941  ORF Transcript_102130/g.255941 Transcript_102130/m.255941 type:complete len:216 (+) Transcript_102130:395-1042(+)